MSSDDEKKKLNQEFEAWDREHREPTSPAPEEEVYVLPDDVRARMELEARLQRGVNGIFAALRNKPLQAAIRAEHAAIKAKLDAELGQEPDRQKAAHPTPQRSLEPAPPADPKARTTDIKPRAPVVVIPKPTAITEKTAADPAVPNIPEPPIPAAEASTEKSDPEQLLAQRRELKRKLEDRKGLTRQEAAIYYNKSTRTIFRWCEEGPLKVVKPRGRITAKSILDFPPEDDLDGPE